MAAPTYGWTKQPLGQTTDEPDDGCWASQTTDEPDDGCWVSQTTDEPDDG